MDPADALGKCSGIVTRLNNESGSQKVQHHLEAISHKYSSVTRHPECIKPKTHRIWNGRRAPDRLPMSFPNVPS